MVLMGIFRPLYLFLGLFFDQVSWISPSNSFHEHYPFHVSLYHHHRKYNMRKLPYPGKKKKKRKGKEYDYIYLSTEFKQILGQRIQLAEEGM